MAATHGVGTYGNAVGTVTPLDHKMAQLGLVVKTAANTIRPGLFWDGNTTIVSGKANMSLDIRAFTAVLSRGATAGAVLLSNDAVLNLTTDSTGATLVAPGSNSVYWNVFVWQREFSIDGTNSNPVIAVLVGTTAASPTVPALTSFPGAVSLATVLVPAGTTATNSGTTITQTAPFTAMSGGVIPFRTSTERDAGTYVESQLGWLIDVDKVQVYNGSSWADATSVGVIASGTFTTASSIAIDGLTGYSKYRITVNIPTSSADNDLTTVRLRAGGVADTSTNHDIVQRLILSNNTSSVDSSFGVSSWVTLLGANRADKVYHLEVDALNAATRTMVTGDASGLTTATAASSIVSRFTLRHRSATVFNGVEFTTTTGTVTGTYTVEGVR